jgi:predicted HicB family RNase H-like nuclease
MQEYLLVHDILTIPIKLQDKELNEIIEEKIKNRVNEEKK